MKIRLLPYVAAVLAVISIMTSCLDSEVEQITYVPESSITSFSVGTLYIDRTGKDRNGNDSAYVDTIDCSDYPFTIDQMRRTIENKDSFPVGTHTDKVVTQMTYDGGVAAYRPTGSQNDTVWTSTDSIDFTTPLQFRVYTTSGATGKAYTVTLNVHKVEPDTITWKSYENLTFEGGVRLTRQNTVYADGKLYTCGDNGGTPVVQRTEIGSDVPSEWTSVPLTTGLTPYSAIAWLDKIYFLNDTGNLYTLDPATETVAPATETAGTFNRLLAADNSLRTLYAVKDGKTGTLSADGTWTDDAEQSPELAACGQRVSSFTEPLEYNSAITRTTLLLNSMSGDTIATAYQRLSSEDGWMRIKQDEPLPDMAGISMIRYDGQLYAFGGPSTSADSEIKTAFLNFYSSGTSGVEWEKVTECMYFPETFAAYYTPDEGSYSAEVNPPTEFTRGNFIWIVWENGSISRGRINRLGFNPKW